MRFCQKISKIKSSTIILFKCSNAFIKLLKFCFEQNYIFIDIYNLRLRYLYSRKHEFSFLPVCSFLLLVYSLAGKYSINVAVGWKTTVSFVKRFGCRLFRRRHWLPSCMRRFFADFSHRFD